MPDTPRTFVGAATFRVTGLTSSDAAHAVLIAVRAVTGVTSATADTTTCTLTVTAGAPLDRADIVAAVRRAGAVVEF